MAPHNAEAPTGNYEQGTEPPYSTSSASTSPAGSDHENGDGGDLHVNNLDALNETQSDSSITISETSSSSLLRYKLVEIPVPKTLREFLCETLKTEELEPVEEVQLRVLASEVSLQRLHVHLPNLKTVNLHGSYLLSVRDLGCNLMGLRVLNITKCDLDSLDGVQALTGLEELYAGMNRIEDLAPCATLANIKIIDAKENAVGNIHSIGFLSMCTELCHLNLEKCIVTMVPEYRLIIKYFCPSLLSLDGESYDPNVNYAAAVTGFPTQSQTDDSSDSSSEDELLPSKCDDETKENETQYASNSNDDSRDSARKDLCHDTKEHISELLIEKKFPTTVPVKSGLLPPINTGGACSRPITTDGFFSRNLASVSPQQRPWTAGSSQNKDNELASNVKITNQRICLPPLKIRACALPNIGSTSTENETTSGISNEIPDRCRSCDPTLGNTDSETLLSESRKWRENSASHRTKNNM